MTLSVRRARDKGGTGIERIDTETTEEKRARAAGRHDLTQILTGHSVVGSGDYWLEMGATGRDGEWRVFRHKKDPNKEWKYELIEDDEGNKLIFHTYNERNLGEKKDLREEKACVDGD